MKPRLSILIATIGKRNDKFVKLVEELIRQAENLPIEIIAYWNNGEHLIGEIRQSLMEASSGEYICFIDDDDWVPDYYCAEIMANLGEDYIGFQVELFEGDEVLKPVYHSIKYGIWHQDDEGYYRGVTHLNPIKRSLALKSKFGVQGAGEDESWAITVTPLVRTENYIKKIMYYYHHDMNDTSFGTIIKPKEKYTRPHFEHAQFKWHPKSTKEGVM